MRTAEIANPAKAPVTMTPALYRVENRRRETADTHTLTLVPTQGTEPSRFLPGQFNMLYVFGHGIDNIWGNCPIEYVANKRLIQRYLPKSGVLTTYFQLIFQSFPKVYLLAHGAQIGGIEQNEGNAWLLK